MDEDWTDVFVTHALGLATMVGFAPDAGEAKAAIAGYAVNTKRLYAAIAGRFVAFASGRLACGRSLEAVGTDYMERETLLGRGEASLGQTRRALGLLLHAAGADTLILPAPAVPLDSDAPGRWRLVLGSTLIIRLAAFRAATLSRCAEDLRGLRSRALLELAMGTGLDNAHLATLIVRSGDVFARRRRGPRRSELTPLMLAPAARRAVEQWLAAASIASGPLFRAFNSNPIQPRVRAVPMRGEAIDRSIKQMFLAAFDVRKVVQRDALCLGYSVRGIQAEDSRRRATGEVTLTPAEMHAFEQLVLRGRPLPVGRDVLTRRTFADHDLVLEVFAIRDICTD